MNLLEDFDFVMIHIIHKILVQTENNLNYLKGNFLKFFFNKYNRLFFKIFCSKYILVKNPRSEEEKIMKDIRNPFRLKKEVKVIKVIVLRNIKKLFEYEKWEGNYYKPVRVNNFWRNNYI